ncbi:MAG: hypothetical protein RLP09_17505, partial [Sandaracinaceae bacterium]
MFVARMQLMFAAALLFSVAASPAHAQDDAASARAAAQVECAAGREAVARGAVEAARVRLRPAAGRAPR